MKEIKAYIKGEKFKGVITALAQTEGVSGVSASDIFGFGRGRGRLRLVNYETHMKIEIVCQDSNVEKIIKVIQKAAHTGNRGDGKIFVHEVQDALRIQTDERGDCVC